ncbi:MAG: DUF1996 domain-containing protein, partial [Polyangiaceae bacterium]|nr:DUF1996 domain-containing protein [Polyangiaceae bacterium]
YWVPALLRPDGNGGYAVIYPEDTYVLDENGVPLRDENGHPVGNANNGPDVYYKHAAAPDPSVIQPYPRGLRMIAGTASATPENPADSGALWACHEENGEWRLHIPSCRPNPDPGGAPYHLHLQIRFPQCWDGVNLDSPDHKSHMAQPVYRTGEPTECPPSHPVWLPEVSYQLYFPITAENVGSAGDTSEWFLASDSYVNGPGSPGGHSAHGDWYMSWNEEVMATFVRYCINERRHCANGELGNGFALSGTLPGVGNSAGLEVINRGRGEHAAH